MSKKPDTKKLERPLDLNLHPRQLEALQSNATEILYGGASRGGKSVLIRLALILWCTWVPGLQCYLFRKYYADVISNHMEGPIGFRALLANWMRDKIVKVTETDIRWVHTGSLISLNACAHDEDLEKHQGTEKHVLAIDEATQIKERHLRWLRGWVSMGLDMQGRVPEALKGKFPRILYTANPIGISSGYFRREFVKARPAMRIERTTDDEGGFLRQYIPAKLTDNPSEDQEAARRRLAGMGDEVLSKALIEGDWDAPVGEFYPQYSDEKHSTRDFKPPEHWFKFRTFDWGSAEPFAVIWWAVSDGEEFTDGVHKRYFPRSSLIAYREWYGSHPSDPSKGIQMRNEDVAQGILARTLEKTSGITITDSLPFQDRGMSKNGKAYRIADVFSEEGCPLTLGNTARVHGWSQLRDRLIGIDNTPRIYFTDSCKNCKDYIPALGRSKTNPEDAEEDGEATHICDAIRLACTARPFVWDAKPTSAPKPKGLSLTPSEILKELSKQKSYEL
jgi:hypothetical protein